MGCGSRVAEFRAAGGNAGCLLPLAVCIREPQHKEGHHQAYGHPQSPALAWGPQPGQDGANAGIEEDHGKQGEEKPQEVLLEAEEELPDGPVPPKIRKAVPHAWGVFLRPHKDHVGDGDSQGHSPHGSCEEQALGPGPQPVVGLSANNLQV